jgi:thioredoxin 1
MIGKYFSAPWCIPCKTFRPVAEKVFHDKGIPLNMIDAESQEALDYGIMSLPTIVLVHDGAEVGRIVGNWPENRLVEKVDEIGQMS